MKIYYYNFLKLYVNLYYLKVDYDESKINTVNPRGTINNIRQRICI